MRLDILTGKTFDRLTVINRATDKGKKPAWLCLCQCGNTKVVVGQDLKRGSTRSCGCIKATLGGYSQTYEYRQEYNKAYYQRNQDKIKKAANKYSKENPDKIKTRRDRNRDKVRAYHRSYIAMKMETDAQYKIASNLRRRLNVAIRGKIKFGSAIDDLGCSIPEFIQHIERQFQSDMTWNNWGRFGWHLDHIKPLKSFDLTQREQLLQACHYTNYQPLWWWDNISKGSKV